MRRRTISEHDSDQSAASSIEPDQPSQQNSRLIAEYNLESSYQLSSEHDLELGNSKQTLKNKAALRIAQLQPTGHRLIDTSNYVSAPEGRRVRSFLNSSVRQKTRLERYNSRLQQSSRIQQSSGQQLITLPEPEPTSVQMGYLLYLNRHRSISKPYQFARQIIRRSNDISVAEEYERNHHRCFEEAKLRYYDNMVPKKMKVGANPLKMYKHREKKRENSRLMLQLTQL